MLSTINVVQLIMVIHWELNCHNIMFLVLCTNAFFLIDVSIIFANFTIKIKQIKDFFNEKKKQIIKCSKKENKNWNRIIHHLEINY